MALNASAGESVPPGGIVLSLWEGISSTPLGGRIQNRFIFVTVIVIVIAITALVVEPGEKCLDQANREWFYIFGYTASPFFYFHRIAWTKWVIIWRDLVVSIQGCLEGAQGGMGKELRSKNGTEGMDEGTARKGRARRGSEEGRNDAG